MGFSDTQNSVSTAFVYDTIPLMKTMERMTNPCFQDNEFCKVMKGKHVTHDPEESAVGVAEYDGEVSGMNVYDETPDT